MVSAIGQFFLLKKLTISAISVVQFSWRTFVDFYGNPEPFSLQLLCAYHMPCMPTLPTHSCGVPYSNFDKNTTLFSTIWHTHYLRVVPHWNCIPCTSLNYQYRQPIPVILLLSRIDLVIPTGFKIDSPIVRSRMINPYHRSP